MHRHPVDLPHAVPERDPQAVPHHTPARDLVAELRRAVAAHHDVPQLVARAGQPVPLEAGVVGGLGRRRDDAGGGDGEDDDERETGHGRGSIPRSCYPDAVGPDPGAGSGARSSVSTATWESHFRIIAVNARTSSGSNSRPASSSR